MALLLCIAILIAGPAFAEPVAEVVWPEFDGAQHKLIYQYFDGEQWHSPGNVVYRSDHALLSPILGSTGEQQKVLVWSEMRGEKIVLKSMLGNVNKAAINWQKPILLTDRGMQNLGAVMIRDGSGQLWLFWASATVDPSDLYVSVFQNNAWSPPQRVNEP